MKERKKRIEYFAPYDHTGMAAHFEKMAAKGWLLCKMGTFTNTYTAIEPADIHFTVTYFSGADSTDPDSLSRYEEFVDMCSTAGWKLAAEKSVIQVFYSTAYNPQPLDTDPMAQVMNVEKAMLSGGVAAWRASMFTSFYYLTDVLWDLYDNPVRYFMTGSLWYSILPWLSTFFILMLHIGLYNRWLKKAKTVAENGLPLPPTVTNRPVQYITAIVFIVNLVVWIVAYGRLFVRGLIGIVIIVFATAVYVSRFFKKSGTTSMENGFFTGMVMVVVMFGAMWVAGEYTDYTYGIQSARSDKTPVKVQEFISPVNGEKREFYVYDDEIPLKIEDFAEITYEDYSYEYNIIENRFMTIIDVAQDTIPTLNHKELYYQVVKTDSEHFYEKAVDHFTYSGYQTEKAALWGAVKAEKFIHPYHFTYVLQYPDKVVRLQLQNWRDLPDEEQIAIIAEKIARI